MAYIDIEIDKLTQSIENIVTGDSFPTEILPLSKPDLIHLTPKNGWIFDHYTKTLGAMPIGGQCMAIADKQAAELIKRYFNDTKIE
jgi:hypothetical protein